MSKSFKKMTEPTGNNLMLVDSLNLAFRWKHQGARIFADEYISTIKSLAKSYSATEVLILSDWGSSSFRKSIYPEYKQNRADKRAEQTEAEAEYFEVFFAEYLECLERLKEEGFTVLRYKGVEADDIAAFICVQLPALNFDHTWLISSDRDWDLLISEGISRFSYVTRKEVTEENWHEHYEFSISQYPSIKAIMGDAGDNVIGVNKVGPKTALKLVEQYGDIYELAASIPLPGKYVYIKNINEFGPQKLLLNMQLVDLIENCEEAVGKENAEEILNILGL